ncbi:MAG TPA: GNAT family N-acetyltransferase [Erysipelotrichaceae bacterium]|nr:GNAT family N-acetyltransferase [Erysipelotrichaceae bacterium]
MILSTGEVPLETTIIIISIAATLLTIFIISFLLFFFSHKKNLHDIFEKEYNSLLEKGLENPSLRDPLKTSHYDDYSESDRAFYLKYSAYAQMVWNFLKTIYDLSSLRQRKYRNLYRSWFPVIIEENKLHYHWFIKNHELFSPKFQDYVKNIVSEITLELKTDIDSFNVINQRLKKEFPLDEQKDDKQMMDLLIKGYYRLFIARFAHQDKSDKSIIGYVIYYTNKDNNFLFLDYLNILPEYQNSGHGSKIFNLLMKEIKGRNPHGVLFEIETSKVGGHSLKNKRRQFYTNLGASELYCPYRAPCDNHRSIPMSLMFRPVEGKDFVRKEDIRSFMKEAISKIHAEYPHTPEVINTYIDEIPNYEANSSINLEKGSLLDYEKISEFLNMDSWRNLLVEKDKIHQLLENKIYNLILLKDQGGNLLGYAFVYLSKKSDFLFIDSLKILPFYQNHGYEKMFIQKLCVKTFPLVKYGIVGKKLLIDEKKISDEQFAVFTNGYLLDGEYSYFLRDNKVSLKLIFYPKEEINNVKGNEFNQLMDQILLDIYSGSDVININHGEHFKKNKDFIR